MSLFAYSVFAEFLKLKWNPTRFSDLGIIIYSTDLETNYGPELRFKDRTNTNSFEKLAGDKSHPTRKNYDNKSLMLSRITHLFFFFLSLCQTRVINYLTDLMILFYMSVMVWSGRRTGHRQQSQ